MSEHVASSEINNNGYTVLSAAPGDSEGIVDVQIKTWIDTYVNEDLDITEELILERFLGKNNELKQGRIERGQKKISESPFGVFVVKYNDEVVGFSSPFYDEEGQRQRLGGLYVLPKAQGKGLGKRLLQNALNSLDSSKDVYLHVVPYNANAISFYKRNGFTETGRDMTSDAIAFSNGAQLPTIEMVKKAS